MNTTKCRGCGADIIWVVTEHTHKKMPIDATPEKRFVLMTYGRGEELLAMARNTYVSHFATCPKASEFRKEQGDE